MADQRPSQNGWQIVVPRLWGWCPWGVIYESEYAATAALVQFGPLDGKVLRR